MKRDWFDLLEDYQAQPLDLDEENPYSSSRIREMTMKRMTDKKTKRRRLPVRLLTAAAVAAVVLAALGYVFAPQLMALFRADDLEVIAIGTTALRMQCVSFPLMAWFFPSSMTLQTIGQSAKASVLAMCRQGLFFLPLILVLLILPNVLGITGIQLSQPFSDLCSFLVALPMGIGVLRELKAAQLGEEARKS